MKWPCLCRAHYANGNGRECRGLTRLWCALGIRYAQTDSCSFQHLIPSINNSPLVQRAHADGHTHSLDAHGCGFVWDVALARSWSLSLPQSGELKQRQAKFKMNK